MSARVVHAAWSSVALVATLGAQTTVKLKSSAGRTDLQKAIIELTQPDHVAAAQRRLWRSGLPAVPLLAAEVERGGAGEQAALFVLRRLGGEAAAAAPVLRRIVAAEQRDPERRSRIAAVLAEIDGPPIVLVSEYMSNAVVELDLDGKELRRVTVTSPWGAWPMPGDHLGVLAFGDSKAVELTWNGKSEQLLALPQNCGSFVPLPGGDVIYTRWDGRGSLGRRTPDGEKVWEIDPDVIRVEQGFGGELVAVMREQPAIAWYSAAGEKERAVELPELGHHVRELPGGNFLVACAASKVLELGPDGSKLKEIAAPGLVNDAVRLRDGRTLVATEKCVVMFGADGAELWRHEGNYCGPLFVRAPPSDH